jgi:hypothetical protein
MSVQSSTLNTALSVTATCVSINRGVVKYILNQVATQNLPELFKDKEVKGDKRKKNEEVFEF